MTMICHSIPDPFRQDHTIEEVRQQLGCGERTVRRMHGWVRQRIEEMRAADET